MNLKRVEEGLGVIGEFLDITVDVKAYGIGYPGEYDEVQTEHRHKHENRLGQSPVFLDLLHLSGGDVGCLDF